MKSILLVEDDPFLIDIYTTKLKEAGFNVSVAVDGEEALNEIKDCSQSSSAQPCSFVKGRDVGRQTASPRRRRFGPKKELDLLILDIVLPHIDGWEILKKVKNNPDLKDLKVVILSNLGQKDEVEEGLKLGAIKYLIKAHYTPAQVVEEIKKILK